MQQLVDALDDKDKTETDATMQLQVLSQKYLAQKEELKACKTTHKEKERAIKKKNKNLAKIVED